MNDLHFDEEYIAKIKNDLAHDSFKMRKNCLEELRRDVEKEIPVPDPNMALSILKLILKVFSDGSESCRERAIQVTTICLNSWPLSVEDTVFLLFPTLHKRLESREHAETSEEIRLLLVRLLRLSIEKCREAVSPFVVDIVGILNRCICDRCPDVIKESCNCLDDLAEAVPEFRLHSERIVEPLIVATKHKHYKIRVAAIHSLGRIIPIGRCESFDRVCGALGECLLDQNPHVRRAVYKVASSWLMELPDRYSYFHYILPLILTGLNDENCSHREEAQNWWHEIGLQYVKENEEHLKDKYELLPTELENYPFDVERPNLGCRTLVSKEVHKIIPTLLKELEDWKPEVRIKASELLEVMILHAEVNIVSLLETLLPILCKVCSKREEVVNQRLIKSGEIIGYFISPKIYWQLMVPQMKVNCSMGHYVIFASLLKHSPKSDISEQLNEIISVMIENNFVETRELISLQSLLKIISKLINCCEGILLDDNSTNNLHLVILSIMAFGNEDIRNEAAGLIQKLACSFSLSIHDLHKKCLPSLFSRLLDNCEMWESYSLDLSVLMTVLSLFSDDVFEFVFDELLKILNTLLKSSGDKEIIFKCLYTLAALLNDGENKNDKLECFERIILGPLKQQLIWRAGKTVEVIRATALSIILLFLKRNGNLSAEFFSEIVPLVISLCEDTYEETRIYSLEILSCIGLYGGRNIDVTLFKQILIVVAGRLEDKRDSVRLKAVQSLKNILLNAPRLDSLKEMPDFEHVVKALQLLFISADDSNEKIQDSILELFKEPQIVTSIKSVFPEGTISSFVRKCRHKNVSSMLETYLKL